MMTPPETETVHAWRTLEFGGGSDEFAIATLRLDLDAGYGPIRIAIGPDGEDRLLIPTEPGRRIPDSVSTDAVGVKVVQFVVEGRPRPFIEMICVDRNLQAPFRALVDDVLRRLRQGDPPERAVVDAVRQFRELLRQNREYSLEELVGLFGELHVLNELLALNPDAAGCWTGPLRQRHDFSSEAISAEVKSTLNRGGRKIHISSLEQLEPSAGRPLVLFHAILERSGTAGETVRDLVERASRLATDAAVIDRAMDGLNIVDWRTSARLAMDRFTVFRVEVFRVEGNFPSIVRASFLPGLPPPGVMNVEYALDLDLALSWRLPQADVPVILSQLASAH
jgi:hypothetical protein